MVLGIIFFADAVGPDFTRPPVGVSQTWLMQVTAVKTEAAEYRNWWQSFNDPVLDKLIDRAYRENLSLRIAGVRVLEARAQLGIAVGGLYPQTQQGFGSFQYNRLSERSFSCFKLQPGYRHLRSDFGQAGNSTLGFRRAVSQWMPVCYDHC
jgi:outer membrane protein TolC